MFPSDLHICSCCLSPRLCASWSPNCSPRSCDASRWTCVSFQMAIWSYSAEAGGGNRKKKKKTLRITFLYSQERVTHSAVADLMPHSHNYGCYRLLKCRCSPAPGSTLTPAKPNHTHTSLSLAKRQNGPLSELKGGGLVFGARLPPPPHNWTTNGLTGTRPVYCG